MDPVIDFSKLLSLFFGEMFLSMGLWVECCFLLVFMIYMYKLNLPFITNKIMEPAQKSRYKKNLETGLEQIPQDITRQDSGSPRAKIHSIGSRPPVAEPFFCREAFQPVVSKLQRHHTDLLSIILSNCDLPTILRLRLVSKVFWLASVRNADVGSPLSDKISISFSPFQVYPPIKKRVNEKYNFASALNSVPENKLKLVVKIADVDDLHQLWMLLSQLDAQFTSKNSKNLLQEIKELNFNRLKINKDSRRLFEKCLNTISNNEKSLPNLESLHIGDIEHNIKIKFPKLCNLKELHITGIEPCVNLNLDACEELESVHINGPYRADGKITLKLAKKLDKLKTLSINSIGNSKIILPENMKNLTSLNIDRIAEGNQLIFPNIDNLRYLRYSDTKFTFVSSFSTYQKLNAISDNERLLTNFLERPWVRDLDDNIAIKFPKLHNLKKLDIKIEKGVSLDLESCEELESFSLKMSGNNTLKLAKSLDKLKTLTINGIENSKIILPENIKNLTSLAVGDIAEGNQLIFPNIDNLKDLTYSDADDVSRVIFVSSLSTVQNLTIKKVDCTVDNLFKTALVVSGVAPSFQKKPNFGFLRNFPNLHLLSIGKIDEYTILELPKINYTDLKEFSIGSIEEGVTLKIPTSFPKTVQVSIGSIERWDANLDLPFFGDGEMKKHFKDAWKEVLPKKEPTNWKQVIGLGIIVMLGWDK